MDLLPAITIIIFVGVAAHWLAWRFQIASIILLLLFGLILGPFSGLINPDVLFGDMLPDLVALGVALILFEGGLNLRIDELRTTGDIVRNLITIGILVTWIAIAIAAYFLLDLSVGISAQLGAILVVSGPTVIGPLLRQVRLSSHADSALEWEGILNDPIGALLAVLVYEVLLASPTLADGTTIFAIGLFKMLFVSIVLGLAGAKLLTRLIRRYWIPDHLYNPVSLGLVLLILTISNQLAPESGLLAVTLMGIVVGNQRSIATRDLIEFKEDLRVLILSGLFIVLTARLELSSLIHIDLHTLLFVLALIFIIRPLAVFLSAIGSKLTIKERVFVAFMAPRGIVAAVISSIFGLQLAARGFSGADQLVPLTFFVIIVTVSFYSIIARPFAKLLNIAEPHPNGFLIIGAHMLAREIARVLKQTGNRILLLDNQRDNINEARMAGLPCHYGNVFSDKIRLYGIGRLLAMSPNNELNSLAVLHYLKIFDRMEVYQLAPEGDKEEDTLYAEENLPKDLRGRYMFKPGSSFSYLYSRILSGAVIKKVKLTENFSYEELGEYYRHTDIPLFLASDSGDVTVITQDAKVNMSPGHNVVVMVEPREGEKQPGVKRKKYKIVKGKS